MYIKNMQYIQTSRACEEKFEAERKLRFYSNILSSVMCNFQHYINLIHRIQSDYNHS